MKLLPVTGKDGYAEKSFSVYCKRCNKRTAHTTDQPIYADLDGTAFKDYYCTSCAYSLNLTQEI